MQLPILTSVAQRVGEQALIAKVNVDDSPITAQKFEVKSIPTLILFRDGEPIKRFVGVQTEPVLLSEIEAAAGTPAT
jgi:thioredoxin 1